MRSEAWLKAFGVAALAAALLLPACGRTVREASVADTRSALDVTSELDFWDDLAMQDAVTNHDALHALILAFDLLSEAAADHENEGGAEAAAPAPLAFDTKVALARERGWIAEDAVLTANETARVGWVARAVCLEAGIDGGLSMRLFGPIPRYALRELTYERLMGTKSENQALSGLELIATIGRVQDRRTGLVSAPRQDF